jgi:hypothetical protein
LHKGQKFFVCAGVKLCRAVFRLSAGCQRRKQENKAFAVTEKITELEVSISQCTGIFKVLSVKLLHVGKWILFNFWD